MSNDPSCRDSYMTAWEREDFVAYVEDDFIPWLERMWEGAAQFDDVRAECAELARDAIMAKHGGTAT